MKPLPRSKSNVQHALGERNQGQPGGPNASAAYAQLPQFGAHAAQLPASPSPSPVAPLSDANLMALPPNLSSAQNVLNQYVNSIVASYASSPELLASLQNDVMNILHGRAPAPAPLNPPVLNASVAQSAPSSNQQVIDGLVRFLTQQQGSGMSGLAMPGPAAPYQAAASASVPPHQVSVPPSAMSSSSRTTSSTGSSEDATTEDAATKSEENNAGDASMKTDGQKQP